MRNKRKFLSVFFIIALLLIPYSTVFAYDLGANHDVNLYYTNPEEVAKIQIQIWGEMRTWGITEEGCAGVIGNMMAESGCDYTRTQSNVPWSSFVKGQTGLGLTQWTYYTRQDGLFAVADSLGKQWNTLEAQMAMLKQELSEGYDILFSSTDVNACSDYFLRVYENPAVHNVSARRELASTVYNSLKGTPAKALGDASPSSPTTSEENTEDVVSAIVKEWDLIGMPSKSVLGEKSVEVVLPTRGNLGIGEAYSVQRVKEDIETSKVALAYTNVRVAVVFIGLFMVFYSVLLLLSFMFDKANQFIEISLIKIISFGFLEYSDDDTAKGETGYASTGRILIIIVVICIIGLLLISGGVLPFIMELTRGIYQKFS